MRDAPGDRRSLALAIVAAASVVSVVSLLHPGTALSARLAGGREQAAVRRAFDTTAAHRRRLIVSIRTSTVSPAWAVVRSVTPVQAGRTSPGAAPLRLSSAYYHRVGGGQRGGSPPAAVRSDLDQPFRIAVAYQGSGSEAISYDQPYGSECAGQGGFVDSETVSVTPMSWSVRYVVDLDDVLAAARSSQGTVIVPEIAFEDIASTLDVTETLSRTVQDVGCNGSPRTYRCTETFHTGGPDPATDLSLTTSGGLTVGVPMQAVTSGTCDPTDYTLGPSLWDSGAATATAPHLGLVGGSLPANPYAPVRVAWPRSSGPRSLATSPCQGDGAACTDRFRWRGTVRLQPVS